MDTFIMQRGSIPALSVSRPFTPLTARVGAQRYLSVCSGRCAVARRSHEWRLAAEQLDGLVHEELVLIPSVCPWVAVDVVP